MAGIASSSSEDVSSLESSLLLSAPAASSETQARRCHSCSEPPEHDANVAFEVREAKQATERAKGICREEDPALLKTSMACWEQLLQKMLAHKHLSSSADRDGKCFLATL